MGEMAIPADLCLIVTYIRAGSGIASAFLSNLLGRDQSLIISTDINPYACKATLRTATANDVSVRGLGSDPILDFYLPWPIPKPQRIFRWAPKLEIIEMELEREPMSRIDSGPPPTKEESALTTYACVWDCLLDDP
ncbi:hypothetical protein I316_05212 [Kwoniella heveanensis BCC8398]|uniref:Uncharacterized protein n=1 Tax=Kwoniella heveanensis BCC8398 TaxID=1296120 RepID=A0A1B9GQ80_9TREE|nr:hypothetical protein I316_05212 [Kwoniella heveanensis BCC8398]